MPRRVPGAVWKAALAQARERYVGLPGVLAVGLGRRRVGGRWRRNHVITVFVERKTWPLEDRHRLPAAMHFQHGGRPWEIPLDVIQVGAEPGLAQGLVAVGGQVSVEGIQPAGTVSWTVDHQGCRYLLTAEHVVGLGSRGPVYSHPDHLLVGHVTATAYHERGYDIARVSLAQGWAVLLTLPGLGGRLPPPRMATDRDTGRLGRVFLPGPRKLQDVTVRNVNVTSLPFRVRSGAIFTPRDLILTDPVTRPGDSGTLLFGGDGSPMGLLTGLYVDPGSGEPLFSCFTELLPALSAVLG